MNHTIGRKSRKQWEGYRRNEIYDLLLDCLFSVTRWSLRHFILFYIRGDFGFYFSFRCEERMLESEGDDEDDEKFVE